MSACKCFGICSCGQREVVDWRARAERAEADLELERGTHATTLEECERLNALLVKQHLAYADLMAAYASACDVATHNYGENERLSNQACGWAFDAGLALVSGVRCYWCKENLGNEERDILAHVAQCRNGIMGVAS